MDSTTSLLIGLIVVSMLFSLVAVIFSFISLLLDYEERQTLASILKRNKDEDGA